MKRIPFALLLFCLVPAGAVAQEKSKAYIVSDAHFDSQWNWDVQRSIQEFIPKTMDRNLFLLERYPDYVFNFEGGVKYSWMKEYYPEKYELVKEYINKGRWHVTGSTWDANDTNIPSPESFTRNILYGQRFYREEFGVEGTDIFLPDCFGFGWTLPSVAAHSGLIGFSTQKLMWRHRPFHGNSKIPFEIGLWQGVDGSRIMLVADAHNYTTRWRYEDLSNNQYLRNIALSNPLNAVYHYYGTGDTGGSPSIESVRALELGLKGNGPVKIISAESDRLYKDYLPFESHPELPVWDGELLMDVHATGCYTSQAAMKYYNRRNETLADAAERSAVAADWLGSAVYPEQFLNEAWKRFIWHQFHDDLTGTSIPRAYEFSWNDELISMKQFADVVETSVGAVAQSLDTYVKGVPVVLYNPAGFEVSDVVEVTLPGKFVKVTVRDDKGRQVPSQVVSSDDVATKILVKATVPATGYAVYDVRRGASGSVKTMSASKSGMENSVYRVAFDRNGDIASVVDKRNGRELVKDGGSIRLALFTQNESFSWPAWEILKKTVDAEPVPITDSVSIDVIENGPLRSVVRVMRKYGESSFCQYVTLNEGGQSDRIDIRNEVDWQTSNALLKAEFPLSVSNGKATYDLGLGCVERGNNTDNLYEVYAQQWTDLSDKDGGYGVSVLNDSKYGWDKPDDNTVRLTLLHTPKTGGGYSYQSRQDMGRHAFTYSIVGHSGNWSGTVRKAEVLNRPVLAFVSPKHKGALGRSFSFVRSLNDAVDIRALKHAEDCDAYVVRVYESSGNQQDAAALAFAADIIEAKELNGNEDVKGDAEFSGNKLSFSISKFGMKTFMVRLAEPSEKVAATVSVPVELPYNTKISSYNAFRTETNFDSRGNSYAAELVPRNLIFKGVEFKLEDGTVENGVKCHGETVELPEGQYNRLYLLAAATSYDVNCVFTVDGTEHPAVIPYYSGFVGQWGHTGHTEGYLKPAEIAFVGTHRHSIIKNADLPYEYTYMFRIGFDIPAGAKRLTLPDNPQVVVFAASVAADKASAVAPACDVVKANLPAPEVRTSVSGNRNILVGRPVVERTGEVNNSERAELALDGNLETKWCDYSGAKPKFITIDLQEVKTLRGWSVMHAGLEDLDYITKEYSLQVSMSLDGEWKTVDTVYDNSELETDRLLPEPVKARYVRLSVSKPDQSEGGTARIYEFSVY